MQYLTILSNNEARKNIIELNVASNSDVVSENVVEKEKQTPLPVFSLLSQEYSVQLINLTLALSVCTKRGQLFI